MACQEESQQKAKRNLFHALESYQRVLERDPGGALARPGQLDWQARSDWVAGPIYFISFSTV